jgi:hypothetical protein
MVDARLTGGERVGHDEDLTERTKMARLEADGVLLSGL